MCLGGDHLGHILRLHVIYLRCSDSTFNYIIFLCLVILVFSFPGSNIEKSVKDLQRCTVSLARYRVVVKEEMDASIKKMKQAFAELQSW